MASLVSELWLWQTALFSFLISQGFFIVSILLAENPENLEYINKSTQTYTLNLKQRPCPRKRGCMVTLLKTVKIRA
jgi:hypothetical protein